MRSTALWGRAFLGALATTALVVACGGSSGGGGDATSSAAFITSLCDLLGSCCKDGKTYSQQKCTDFYNAILGTGYVYDSASGQTCLDKTRAAQSSPTFCAEGAEDDAICKKVFTKAGATGGTKQPGELCEQDDECAPQTDGKVNCSTFSTSQATTKKCQVFVRAKAGDACADDVEDEDTTPFVSEQDPRVGICYRTDSLYCDKSATKKCAPLVAAGGACTSSFSGNECISNHRCDAKTRTCVALLAQGADCTPSTSSFDNPCADKTYCDKASKKCVPAKKNGEACTDQAECGDSGCFSGKCGVGSGGSSASTQIACN